MAIPRTSPEIQYSAFPVFNLILQVNNSRWALLSQKYHNHHPLLLKLLKLFTIVNTTVFYGWLSWFQPGCSCLFPCCWYRAVFWIQDDNNVNNTLMVWVLLSSAHPQSKGWSSVKDFAVFHTLSVRSFRRSWEGAQPGQLTQTNQREISHHRMSWPVYKLGRVVWQGSTAAQGWAGQLYCASLALTGFNSPLSSC